MPSPGSTSHAGTFAIRQFQPADAEAVSNLVRHTMAESSTADYPLDRLEPLIEYFSPDKIAALNRERLCLVAEADGRIVGTAALEGDHICTFFVHPHNQRRGIGHRLLTSSENAAATQRLEGLIVEASLGGATFYERHGYERTGTVIDGTAGHQIVLQKAFTR